MMMFDSQPVIGALGGQSVLVSVSQLRLENGEKTRLASGVDLANKGHIEIRPKKLQQARKSRCADQIGQAYRDSNSGHVREHLDRYIYLCILARQCIAV